MKLQSILLRGLLVLPLFVSDAAIAASPQINIYKTKTCGCCGKWVEHLKGNGFTPVVKDVPSTAEYRQKFGVPEQLASCHTATVGGYTVEGHVPAADIHRLLKEKRAAKGLAVPGMPLGSPGMEAGRRDPYAVLLFKADGKTSVFQKYPGD
jgi:hypothetical protein